MPVVKARVAAEGDPWTGMYAHPQSIEPLLAMYEQDPIRGHSFGSGVVVLLQRPKTVRRIEGPPSREK
jgi:hypothetical protein